MSTIKQHIVVDISNESFLTNPYNNLLLVALIFLVLVEQLLELTEQQNLQIL